MASPLAALIAQFQANRVLAHTVLFPKRHPNKTPAFHREILEAWSSAHPRILIEAFRGGAKSTIAEEFLTVGALFGEFQFALIVGNSASAACQRLASVKFELENNDNIESMFGSVVGATWNQDEVVLTNGVRIMALGRGQSPRGIKDDTSNRRPDLVLVDDLEDPESVATPESREKAYRYLTRELIPAVDDPLTTRIRVNGTPLHEDSVIERLSKTSEWKTLRFPIYIDRPDGSHKPVWPDRFPLSACYAIRDSYERDGDLAGFSQEYLCQSIDNQSRTFRAEYLRLSDPARTPAWAPKIIIVDPARTTHATSSRTGYTVFSWLGNQLWVYEAIGAYHTPSEQVDKIFALNDEFHPMSIFVEANGLEEWLMQPLRAEQLRRATMLPIEPIRAPRDKKAFIGGLEPFFRAREVFFCKELPDLKAELLAFPFGKLDVINALAYALRTRPGAPIYPMFGADHITHRVLNPARSRFWLGLNASQGRIIGVFVAVQNGAVHVLRDWVSEGPMADGFRNIAMDLNALSQMHYDVCIPLDRLQPGDSTALVPALRQASRRWREGKRAVDCVEGLTPLLRNREGGVPRLTVAPEATWTLNALSGGYHREVDAQHVVRSAPAENVYSLIAQTLECMVGLFEPDLTDNEQEGLYYGHTRGGRAYLSLRR